MSVGQPVADVGPITDSVDITDPVNARLVAAAKALHDGPLQDLIAARYLLDLALRDNPALATELAPTREALMLALARTRELTTTLRSGS